MTAAAVNRHEGHWLSGMANRVDLPKASGSRPIVLALIIGLHVGVLLYATLLKPTAPDTPVTPPVVMMQLVAQQAVAQPISPPTPPTQPQPAPAPPVPAPPVIKQPKAAVKKTPTQAPVRATPPTRESPTPPVEVVNERAPAPAPSAAAPAQAEPAAPSPDAVAAAAATARASTPAPVAPASAPAPVSQPLFNAAYLNNPAPAYPPLARRMGEEGKVMLRVYVTPEGTAGEVRIQTSSGSSMFDDAAMTAVRQWRFVPARQGEAAVAAWVQVPIVFRLG